MADKTAIEWTDATWNPVRGCSRVSEGCRNCYAETVAARFSGEGAPYAGLAEFRVIGQGTPKERREAHWTGKVRLIEEHLEDPLRWRKPRRIFVNSMSDLFHEALPIADLERVWRVMFSALRNGHTFQVLTKRAARMAEWVPALMHRVFGPHWTMPAGIWLGVSVENQQAADERIPLLLQTPAAVRFLSCEPLLGPVDLTQVALRPARREGHETWIDALAGAEFVCDSQGEVDVEINRIDWVIGGGESGPGARPMHPDWARQLRDQCARAGVPYFFKQHGDWVPATDEFQQFFMDNRGHEYVTGPCGCPQMMLRVGKHRAGHLLDGREWHQFPEPSHA